MSNSQTLEAKIDTLTALVSTLVERQQRQQELLAVLEPIAKEALAVATDKLELLADEGWFEMAQEGRELVRTLVTAYQPEDVRDLAQSSIAILDAVRAVTQPEVMELVGEAGEVLQHGDELEPTTPWEALKAGRDPEVQRGVAITIELLRQLGRAAGDRRAPHEDTGRARRERLLNKRTAPRGERTRPRTATPAPAVPVATRPAADPAPMTLDGWVLDAQGFLAEPESWTEQFAVDMAAALGVSELTDRHWQAIRFARSDWAATGASPNIRRITMGSGVETRELYSLWPAAPGKATARVAGLPKPVGCI